LLIDRHTSIVKRDDTKPQYQLPYTIRAT
jgi:hypothetical protein